MTTAATATRDLRVLLVEDSSDDCELVLLELGRTGFAPRWERVESATAMASALAAGDWDVVLSDYTLPGFGAEAALAMLQGHGVDVPFVVVSGTIGEELAVRLVRAGASDCVLKHDLARLGPAVERALVDAENRRARRSGDQAVHRLATIVQQSGDAILSLDLEGAITSWNPAAERLYGWLAAEVEGRHISLIVAPAYQHGISGRLAQVRSAEPVERFESVHLHRDGRAIDVAVTISPLRDSGTAPIGCSTITRDITDRKRLERERQRDEDSLARDALLLANVRDAVIVTDLDGIVTYWNDGATRLLDWTAEEMLGRPHLERFPAAVRPEMAEQSLRLVAGEDRNAIYEDHRKDGSRVWIDARVRRISDRAGRPIGVMSISHDITARRKAEESLRLLGRAIQAVTSGILITDPAQPDNPIVYASPGFERLTGYPAAEAIGRNCRFLQGPDTDREAMAEIAACVRSARPCRVELLNYRRDGTTFWNELSISPVTDDAGALTHFVGVQTDVSKRRRLEEQYHQAQKMEGIGQLAGGIAHDFNNLLTIINGHADLLLHELSPDGRATPALEEIRAAGERAASLTRQLLTFSRRQVVAPRALDLNGVIADLEKLLHRIIGEDVELSTNLSPGLWAVKADPGQLEQVIVNLAVNARDAMPHGGKLVIATCNAEPDAGEAPAAAPGSVLLTVSDTGSGMTPEVVERIFEPFFTTKGAAKGTGLGLAVVHGIILQAGGSVRVDSQPGRGTTMWIRLPRVDEPVQRKKVGGLGVVPRGDETLLLVEDERSVRALARRVLTGHGYTVLEAADGEEAMEVAAGYDGRIHLLVTDVVMPGIGGGDLAVQLLAERPEMRVLYVSGYTADAVVLQGIRYEQVCFLQKPFTPTALGHKVREALDPV